MQRLRVPLCRAFVVLLGGCGDEPPKATGPAALKYVPAGADAVVVVPTDLQGEQLQRLEALLQPVLRQDSDGKIEAFATSLFDGTDANFARDIEPLLGQDLVLAEWGSEDDPRVLAALGEAVGELEASRDGIDARLRIDIPARLGSDP